MPDSPDTSPSAPRPQTAGPGPAEMPFETGLAELNDIVGRLESGALGLSESILAYERGVSILKHLHSQLADVAERVRTLVRIDDQGRPVLEPPTGAEGGEDGAELVGRRGARSASRTSRSKRLPGMEEEPRAEAP